MDVIVGCFYLCGRRLAGQPANEAKPCHASHVVSSIASQIDGPQLSLAYCTMNIVQIRLML